MAQESNPLTSESFPTTRESNGMTFLSYEATRESLKTPENR
jgi:hypothetical protein